MPTLLTLGGASGRALGHIGAKRRIPVLITQVFSGNTVWVAPAGVTLVTTLIGAGAPGNADVRHYISYVIATVNYISSGTYGNGSTFDWRGPYSYAQSVASDMNADGAASWTHYDLNVKPDQTNVYAGQYNLSDSGNNRDWTVSGPSSGPATSSGSVSINGSWDQAPTTGASSTGFGYTFAGGYGPSVNSVTYTNINIAVVPGTGYTLSVPSGGTITIKYYQ